LRDTTSHRWGLPRGFLFAVVEDPLLQVGDVLSAAKVEGMTCEGCSALVAKAIRTAPSVLAVEVDYQKGEAVVGTEICCPIPEDKILAALKETGYNGKIIENSVRQAPPSQPTAKTEGTE